MSAVDLSSFFCFFFFLYIFFSFFPYTSGESYTNIKMWALIALIGYVGTTHQKDPNHRRWIKEKKKTLNHRSACVREVDSAIKKKKF